jgi:hypothetical protein
MNRRLTAAGLAVLLVPAAAACDPSTSSTSAQAAATTTAAHSSATATASVQSSASPAPSCTPDFSGTDDTGVTLAHGTVTGAMTLTCTPVPTSGEFFPVSIALFYRPTASVGTRDINGPASDYYQDTDTVTAPCKVGLWYIGEVSSGSPAHGPVEDITSCSGDLS